MKEGFKKEDEVQGKDQVKKGNKQLTFKGRIKLWLLYLYDLNMRYVTSVFSKACYTHEIIN